VSRPAGMSRSLSLFLAANAARSFCHRCLAEALETSVMAVYQAINDLLAAREATFENFRARGVCYSYRSTTTVVRTRRPASG
jgi:hypothetical protein